MIGALLIGKDYCYQSNQGQFDVRLFNRSGSSHAEYYFFRAKLTTFITY
jgi:hypothetical protein